MVNDLLIHKPVLLNEVLHYLNADQEGFYVDAGQRNALRRLIRKSIYGITDNLKRDLVDEFTVESNDA